MLAIYNILWNDFNCELESWPMRMLLNDDRTGLKKKTSGRGEDSRDGS